MFRSIPAWALRIYLALSLAGCAGTRPETVPSHQARLVETCTVEADRSRVFQGVIDALQDLSFAIESADEDLGLLTATRESEVRLAEISKDVASEEDGDLPTWATVALIVTGVILVVVLISVIAGDDDDEESEYEEDDHVSTVIEAGEPSPPPMYTYRITINIREVDADVTTVRVSATGSLVRGGVTEEAGPVQDPVFFETFFDTLEDALTIAS